MLWVQYQQVNICFVLCTLTRDYDGIKSRAAVCRNSGERKTSCFISQPAQIDHFINTWLPPAPSGLSSSLLGGSCCQSNFALPIFFSESKCNRLSKIRLALGRGQSYEEKKITIEAELFESHQFLCRPCSGHPLLYYGVVHPVQGALLCKTLF